MSTFNCPVDAEDEWVLESDSGYYKLNRVVTLYSKSMQPREEMLFSHFPLNKELQSQCCLIWQGWLPILLHLYQL